VALKLQAPSLPHKGNAGGVLLNIADAEAVRHGFEHLMNEVAPEVTDREGVLVQQMIPSGLEMIVGVDNTGGFGPMMLLGFGGSQVEQLRDSTMEAAPLTHADGRRMVDALRLGPLLTQKLSGYPQPDAAALIDFLVRLSNFAVEQADRIHEMDVNPVIVTENGVIIVDSLIITKRA
jgi:acetate---CoA ligase (ADP-forming)